jgi:transposase
MTTISKIRREHFVNGKSPHQIAKENRISWATAKGYLDKTPDEIKNMGSRPNRTSLMGNDHVRAEIRRFLQIELEKNFHKKQRYSSNYLFKLFKEKELFSGCSRYFRKIVEKERKSLLTEETSKGFLELNFPLGQYLQVDHGPVEIEYKKTRIKAYLFVASVPQHSLRYCQVYLRKDSISWGDFHDKAFRFFGGVFSFCIYDNDTVLKISANLEQTDFANELEFYYGLQAIYCNKASGWEKGAVENAVGTCRRNYLAGLPLIDDLIIFNQDLSERCMKSINEDVHYLSKTPLKDIFQSMKLRPLPEKWEWGKWEEGKVNSYQCIQYDGHSYSVPEKYIEAQLKIFITSSKVKIYFAQEIIAVHERSFIKGERSLQLDHYLDQLERKPRAFNFAKVVQQEDWEDYIQEVRDRLRNKMDQANADMELVKILKLKRQCSSHDYETAIRLALAYGGITASAIKMFIEQLQLSQLQSYTSIKDLPPQCQIDLKEEYYLDQYQQLCDKGV